MLVIHAKDNILQADLFHEVRMKDDGSPDIVKVKQNITIPPTQPLTAIPRPFMPQSLNPSPSLHTHPPLASLTSEASYPVYESQLQFPISYPTHLCESNVHCPPLQTI